MGVTRLFRVDDDIGVLFNEAAPRPDADAVRALAAARERVLGMRVTTRVGRYVIGELLGSGGMGKVFRARDELLDRDVAIKLIRSGLHVDALQREALALAHLSHPNIVRVFDLGRTPEDDSVFVVMELIRGVTLGRWLDASPRSATAILQVFAQVARGLAAAHQAGIVHGDVKPSNVVIADDGCAKLLDFGLAQIRDAPESRSNDTGGSSTLRGGTPGYMAPEQLEGVPCDARGDQYAFSVALRAALDRVPGVPWAVERVLARGLRREPNRRWPSMQAVFVRIETPRPRRLGAALPIGVAGIIAGALWLSAPPRVAEPPERCPLLPRTWTDARRAATGAGIAAVDRPWSETMATFVVQGLDRRAEALGQAWDATCAASTAAADMAPAHGCLARAAVSLGEVADVLAVGDEAVIQNAPTMLLLLADAPECVSAVGVEPVQAAAAASWAHDLAAGLSAIHAGEFEQARQLARAIHDRAQSGGQQRLVAQGLWLEGLAARGGELPDAEALLRRAVDTATAAGSTGVEFIAAVELVELRVAAGDNADAEHWARQAGAIAGRLSESEFAHARVLAVEAAMDRVKGRVDPARIVAEQARVILETHLGVAHPDVADVRVILGNIALMRGDRATARAELCGAEAVLIAALGESHAATLEVTVRCAVALLHSEPVDAHRRLTALLPQFEAAAVTDTATLASALMHLGIAEKLLGNGPAAVERHLQADAIYTRRLGENHPGRVAVLANLGSALLQTGQPARAEVAYLRATGLAASVLGELHPHTAQTWVGLAEARLTLDHAEPAIEAAERALEIQTAAGFAPAQLAEAQTVLAEALTAARRELPRARMLVMMAHRTLSARSVETKEFRRVVALVEALDHIAPESSVPPRKSPGER